MLLINWTYFTTTAQYKRTEVQAWNSFVHLFTIDEIKDGHSKRIRIAHFINTLDNLYGFDISSQYRTNVRFYNELSGGQTNIARDISDVQKQQEVKTSDTKKHVPWKLCNIAAEKADRYVCKPL